MAKGINIQISNQQSGELWFGVNGSLLTFILRTSVGKSVMLLIYLGLGIWDKNISYLRGHNKRISKRVGRRCESFNLCEASSQRAKLLFQIHQLRDSTLWPTIWWLGWGRTGLTSCSYTLE